MARIFDDYCYEQDRAWWVQQAEVERSRLDRLQREATQAGQSALWGRECAVVALRMLKRAGKLKAITDDERKVLEWAEQLSDMLQPGAQRRLGSPFDEHYSETADGAAQAVLFNTDSQGSVNLGEAA